MSRPSKYAPYTVRSHDGMGIMVDDRQEAIDSASSTADRLAEYRVDGWVEVSDLAGPVVTLAVHNGEITEEWK